MNANWNLDNFSTSTFIVEWNAHTLLSYIRYSHGDGSQWHQEELLDFSSSESFLEIRIISKHNCSYFLNLINVHILAESTPQKTTVKKMTAINASPTTVIPAKTLIGRAVERERERESYGESYLLLVALHSIFFVVVVVFFVCLLVCLFVHFFYCTLPKDYICVILS